MYTFARIEHLVIGSVFLASCLGTLRGDRERLREYHEDVPVNVSNLQFRQSCANWRPLNRTCNHDEGDVCNVDDLDCACDCDAISVYCHASRTPHFSSSAIGSIVTPVGRLGSPRHFAVVGGRVRISGATDVKFLGPDHFVTMSFAAHEMYLYRLDLVKSTAVPVAVVRTTYNNWPASSDLIDWDGGDQLLLSNLFSGSQSRYRVDLEADELKHVADYNTLISRTGTKGKCHSAAFFPGKPDVIIATNSIPGRFETLISNWTTNETLLRIKSNHAWYPQDTVFLGADTRYMFILYTTTGILSQWSGQSMWNYEKPVADGKECLHGVMNRARSPKPCHMRVALYRIDLDGRESEELASAYLPGGHPDSMVYRNGVLFVTDQLNDVVHVFSVDFHSTVEAGNVGFVTMSLLPELSPITGFHMPHGVDVAHGMLAVASYGDNSVKVMPLPLPIIATLRRQQVKMDKVQVILADPTQELKRSHSDLPACTPGRPCNAALLDGDTD